MCWLESLSVQTPETRRNENRNEDSGDHHHHGQQCNQQQQCPSTLNLVSVTEQAHDGLIQVIEGEDVHDRMCEDGCCTESVAH